MRGRNTNSHYISTGEKHGHYRQDDQERNCLNLVDLYNKNMYNYFVLIIQFRII